MMRGLDRDAREAPQGPHPRRGGRGRRPALAPLHLRPPAARQVGQPARHGLRPRRDRPGRDAARGRGLRSARIDHLDVEIGILEREAATGADHERAPRASCASEKAADRGAARRAREAVGRGEGARREDPRAARPARGASPPPKSGREAARRRARPTAPRRSSRSADAETLEPSSTTLNEELRRSRARRR